MKAFSATVLGLLLMLIVMSGCRVYSFTGANIPADIHSFTVELFQNRANNGPASLQQTFTDALKYKFQTEGNLKQTSTDGDLQIKGVITGYVYTSEAPLAGATSGINKLTITVQVEFVNTKNLKDKWTESFSRFATYSSTENINSVQDGLVSTINTQLVDDIFQKALVKW